ncbi:protein son of sevenless-like isoform X1 [Haematobia irritans]
MLPPRDGEISPPPIPPRINTHVHYLCHSTGANFTVDKDSWLNTNSLMLPNTSSIMIRRNSAIEKRANSGNQISNTSSTSNAPPHLSTTSTIYSDDQSISPALSSSTTTSPITPMTPVSPHDFSGCPTADMYQPTQIIHKNISCSSLSGYPAPLLHNQNLHTHHNTTTTNSNQQPTSVELCQNVDNLPKLPPKPLLGGNTCNNPAKCTMFPYPSTNR